MLCSLCNHYCVLCDGSEREKISYYHSFFIHHEVVVIINLLDKVKFVKVNFHVEPRPMKSKALKHVIVMYGKR